MDTEKRGEGVPVGGPAALDSDYAGIGEVGADYVRRFQNTIHSPTPTWTSAMGFTM